MKWNIPNTLTVIRMVLIPAMVIVLFLGSQDLTMRIVATVIFSAAIFTDFLDGKIARRYDLVSDFGKIWDPIADKLLTGAAFISLSILHLPNGQPELPWYFTVVILTREIVITMLREYLKKKGTIMPANSGGKAKTFVQSLALFLFLLHLPFLPGQLAVLAWLLMWAALVLTVITGIDYLRQARISLVSWKTEIEDL